MRCVSNDAIENPIGDCEAASLVARALCHPHTDVLYRTRRNRSILRHLLLQSVASIALLCLGEVPAWADCVLNGDTVTCSGFDADGFTIVPPPPPGPTVVVEVEPSATVNGPSFIDGLSSLIFNNNGQINGNVTVTNNGDFAFDQNGTFGGCVLSVTGSGLNSLLARAYRSVDTATMSGARNEIENFGVLNNVVTLNATISNTIINRTGAAINQLNLFGPSNTIDNDGLFNQGLIFSNNHTASSQVDNDITNRANGVINGLNSTGTAHDDVDNSGTINGPANLGGGNDAFVNRAQPTVRSIWERARISSLR